MAWGASSLLGLALQLLLVFGPLWESPHAAPATADTHLAALTSVSGAHIDADLGFGGDSHNEATCIACITSSIMATLENAFRLPDGDELRFELPAVARPTPPQDRATALHSRAPPIPV